MYFQDDDCIDYSAPCVEVIEKKFGDAKEWLTVLCEQLFGESAIDIDAVDNAIEELCALIEVKYPKEPLNISRPSDYLIEWKSLNNNYLKQLIA